MDGEERNERKLFFPYFLIKRFICIVDNQISIIEEMQLKKQETKKRRRRRRRKV